MDERKKRTRLTDEELKEKERLARKKLFPGEIRPGRPVSEEFWKLSRPKIPVDLLLEALLDDRRQGR